MELFRSEAERILAPNRAPVPPDDIWDSAGCRLGASGYNPIFWCRRGLPLTATDVNPNKNRLLCGNAETNEVLLEALTASEANLVRDKSGELPVVVIHPKSRKSMKLTRWPSSGYFALIGGWKDLVTDRKDLMKENDWENGTPVSIWFFRYGQRRKLGFLITSQ